MRRTFALTTLTLILAATAAPATARDLTTLSSGDKVEWVRGHCIETSHVAEGPLGADLTKRQSRFFCDSAVIMFFKRDPGHVLVQFTEKRSNTDTPIGFGGVLANDGIQMVVGRLYLPTGAPPTNVDDGACKFFFKNKHMEGIFCGAVVDQGDRRIVANIAFDADPGQ